MKRPLNERSRESERHLVRHLGQPNDRWKLQTVPGVMSVMSFVDTPDPDVTTLTTAGLADIGQSHNGRFDQELLLSWRGPDSGEIQSGFLAFVNIVVNAGHPLGRGQVVELSRPLTPRSTMRHVLLDVPHYFDDASWYCRRPAREIEFLWLVPLHAGEAQLVAEHGYEALSELFGEAVALDVTDLSRVSALKEPGPAS